MLGKTGLISYSSHLSHNMGQSICFSDVCQVVGSVFTTQLRKVLFLTPSVCRILFAYEISLEPLNGFAPNSNGRRVWSLIRTSLKVKVKVQGHQGQKNSIFQPFRQPACGLFCQTSLVSSWKLHFWHIFFTVFLKNHLVIILISTCSTDLFSLMQVTRMDGLISKYLNCIGSTQALVCFVSSVVYVICTYSSYGDHCACL